MKKLLLWNACPTNDKGIYNKALLCVNLDNLDKSNTSDDAATIGTGYFVPTESTNQKFKLPSDMNFYFIMKKESNMALLATQSKMDGQFSNQVLYCWVPVKTYVPWNQRSCLEPTWKHDDVEYFADKHITIDVYKEKNMRPPVITPIPFRKEESAPYSEYMYRMPGNDLRFPILDDGTSTIYNMSTFGSMDGDTKALEQGQQKMAEIQQERLLKMMNINLAIVIDGTSSMEPYYPAVKEAIKEGCQAFSKDAKIKIGVVIYRDYTDGEFVTEVLPLRSSRNLSVLNQFLDTGGKYGIKSSRNDHTLTEAMYYGIGTALDKLDFKKEESNIMLVIGDCGNDPKDSKCPTQEELLRKIVDKNVSVMGFQVKNSNVVAYSQFTNQITTLMRKSMQENYRRYNKDIVVATQKTKNGYDYMGKGVEPQIYLSNYRFADPAFNNGQMDPSMLVNHLKDGVATFSQAIQKQMDIIVNVPKSSRPRPDSGFIDGTKQEKHISISDAFFDANVDIDQSLKDVLKHGLLSYRGYAVKQRDGRNLFKPVIFISMEEFDDLLKRMAPVDQAASISNASDRTPYIEAMKALVRSFAPGMTDAEMAALNNAQITAMIGGLNEASEGLAKYKLDDLSNKTVITNPKYKSIITDFARKYKKLKNIRSSKSYKFVKEFNGSRYYWIPIEDLP